MSLFNFLFRRGNRSSQGVQFKVKKVATKYLASCGKLVRLGRICKCKVCKAAANAAKPT